MGGKRVLKSKFLGITHLCFDYFFKSKEMLLLTLILLVLSTYGHYTENMCCFAILASHEYKPADSRIVKFLSVTLCNTFIPEFQPKLKRNTLLRSGTWHIMALIRACSEKY